MTLIYILPELFIFLLVLSLILSFFLWKYLPLLILLTNGIYFIIGMVFFYGSTGIFVILFIFNIPSFSVIGLYCFIYYGLLIQRERIVEIELPSLIIGRKK